MYNGFFNRAVKAQQGGPQNALQEYRKDQAAYDFYHPERRTSQYLMLNFFNNHDQWRLNWEQDGLKKSVLGTSIISFWPGVPLFYYGDEQGFASEGNASNGFSREDFMTSKAWYDIPSKHPGGAAVYDNFNMTSPYYLQVQKLMNVRQQYYSLRNTDEIEERWVQKDNTNGIFAYTRVWAEQKNWALVAFNTWREPLEAGGSNGTFYTGWNEGDVIVNAMNPSERYRLAKGGVLPSLWVGPYETKVFVREDNLQTLNPVVESIEPVHDLRMDAGLHEAVVHFSETMDIDSLRGAVKYDGQVVPADRLRIADDGRSVRFDVEVTPGIHEITVDETAKSSFGKPLMGEFRSRVRSGSDLSPIAKVQKDPIEDSTLVSTTPASTPGAAPSPAPDANGNFTLHLHHKADGAKYYRVSTDKGAHWEAWQPYQAETEQAVKPTGSVDVLVQYWADGSAAYFSHQVVNSN